MGEPALDWSTHWEDDLADDEHDGAGRAAAALLPAVAGRLPGRRELGQRPPRAAAGRPGRAAGRSRTWPCCAGSCSSRPGAQLVGDVGLVGVDPDRRGTGLGAELLARTAAALHALDLPFGFLTCGEQVAGFYAAAGWVRVANPVRMIRRDRRVQVYGGVAMALPVRAGMDAWPAGRMDRNGYEL